MYRQFFPAHVSRLAALRAAQLATSTDVYVGVALRDGNRAGGASAIQDARFLHIETDEPDALALLERFAHPPTIEIASGGPGHRHLYWRLSRCAPAIEVERANRRLAASLGGDPASVDIARILRPPGTLNHGHDPPSDVRLLCVRPEASYSLAELVQGLTPDPQQRVPRRRELPRRPGRGVVDRELLAIAPERYVRVLANATPNRAGKIRCPFHEDRTPSLQLYPDGTFYCFGRLDEHRACDKGGSIFDFAAARWGMTTRGDDFLKLREELARAFGLSHLLRR
jgi:hypothetical protein